MDATTLRRWLTAVWIGLALACLALVAFDHGAPALGYRLVIVGGSSMQPALSLGAIAVERPAPATGVAVGDVVTLAMPDGVAITHRVTRVVDVRGATYLETRGDANEAPDAALVPATEVTGVVAFHLPVVGFLLAFMGSPTGVLCLASSLLALLFGTWLAADRARLTDALPA